MTEINSRRNKEILSHLDGVTGSGFAVLCKQLEN